MDYINLFHIKLRVGNILKVHIRGKLMTKRNLIKQSYELNNARYRLNAVEMDIVLKLITEIKNEHAEFYSYKIKVKDMEARLGKQLDRRALKAIGKSLLSKPLEIPRKEKGFLIANWVSSFEYISDIGEIEISFDPKLKPYLLHLKNNFVITDLRELLKLNSEYSKRLYMLFKQWIGMTQDKIIEVSELQEMFQVPKSALKYAEFKRNVIDSSLKQINKKTDLKVTYEAIKTGRRVTHIKFSIAKELGHQLTFDNAVIDTSKLSFKEQLIKKSPFYFRSVAYRFDGNGLLISGHKIIKSAAAKKLYIEFEKNISDIVSVADIPSVFDYYEKD